MWHNALWNCYQEVPCMPWTLLLSFHYGNFEGTIYYINFKLKNSDINEMAENAYRALYSK